jgi:transcriptional regulator with PAS, ATPase and Fis domain
MKKLIVIAIAARIGEYYCGELRGFFEDDIQIDYITVSDGNINRIHQYDMVVITTHTIIDKIMPHVNEDSKIIKVVKNINPKGIEKINEIPHGSEALVVNVGPKTVSESIYLIYSYGRTDLELHPYYPGIEKYKELDYILTQGELDIVPDYGGKIIDIYNTTIDTRIFLEIISYFKLDKNKFLSKLMLRSSIKRDSIDGVSFVISERYMLENIINVLFENLNEGVLIYNDMGIITSSSDSTRQFLSKASHNIIGNKISELIPLEDSLFLGSESFESVIKVNHIPLICNIMPKMTLGSNDYGLVLLKKYNDAEMKIHMYKKELIDKGHVSKYTIDDIIGSSNEMQKIKNIAIRMAKSNSTVLILGESGTGKELFAHVIHNNSKRNNEQFVAVNCSAIPENLLESELFGYEDGAFTGARKGGKRGLFEIANGGTLFLDEIGEIPLHLQNRLLRVLQEKEIMRVGGNTIINIDVRIIAATNIDLKKQVEAGKFRKDLYYRLSVLPMMIPPLRNRGEDVIEIFKSILREQGEMLELNESVKNFFISYEWDGNVRELSNCIEYLINLQKPLIEMTDLPENMRIEKKNSGNEETVFASQESLEDTILKIIYERGKINMKTGRQVIAHELGIRSVFLGEQEVRKELMRLQEIGLVEVTRGRGGTRITQKGIEQLNS